MARQTLHTDIAIIGGGIAGLWTLNQLRTLGYSAILFEQGALGSEQTIGSQGMIHGGIKYALAGNWNDRAEAVSAMPATWRQCLRGDGKVDLRGTRVLSEDFFLWSSGRLQSLLTTFFASKMLRGRVQKVTARDRPATLQSPDFHGQVYRLEDLVLDVPSLVTTLAGRQRDAIFRIDWRSASLSRDGNRALLQLPGYTVVPRRLVLAAGAGNEALIEALGASGPAMQRRPLQQVLVKHQYRDSFYGHCIGTNPSPRLTVSSHISHDNSPVWYLGGELASSSADVQPWQLIERAREELKQLLPWVDLGQAEWRTIRLDRAEPADVAGLRPQRAFVGKVNGVDNALAAWPTKLTLCPDLADSIEHQLLADGLTPKHRPDLAILAPLGTPPVATPYWDTLFP